MRYSFLCCVAWLAVFGSAAACQSAGQPDFLSELEAGVLREQNFARTDPAAYADLLAATRSQYDGSLIRRPGLVTERTREGVAALDEAVAYLRSIAPLEPLRVSLGMSEGARDHVADQGFRGLVGHVGTDSSQVWDRVARYGHWLRSVAENIAYGPDLIGASARLIVMQLIVDDGVQDRGHRLAMLDRRFTVAGVACGPHSGYSHMCVVTYAADYREN